MLAEMKEPEKREDPTEALAHAAKREPEPRKHPRGVVMAGALLVLSASAVISTGVAVWAWRAEAPAREALQQAEQERDQTRLAAAEANHQREQALEAQRATAEQRDEALAAKKQAQRSDRVNKAVLAFLQNTVLSAGHSMGWGGDQARNVRMRQAVDAAEPKVAKAFADQPLIEASVREILASTYLDLGEATLGTKQLERALALRERVLGADDPDTCDCRNKLAVAYRLAGQTAEASRLYERQSAQPAGRKPKVESR
jgi:hypothetical protein